MTQKLLLALTLFLLAVGAFLWIAAGAQPAAKPAGLEAGPSTAAVESTFPQALPTPGQSLPAPRIGRGSLETTVVLPLIIDLDLISATTRLHDASVAARGSAASAHLRGSMHGAGGRGLLGYAEFIAGPNRGRVLTTDDQGRFGANDLYAGLSLVALRAPGSPGALREVLLREGRDSQLNVGYGRPAQVRGLVKDAANNPLSLATVEMDGQKTQTDRYGKFYFPRMTAGKVPVYVSKPGFASQREMQFITAGMNMPPDKLRFNLRRGSSLTVVIPERIGGPGPGLLYLSGMLDGSTARTYPWHTKSPISMHGGESLEIEDLPPGRIRLQYFRTGALAQPSVLRETLMSEGQKTVTIHLKPAPTLVGRVMQDGALVKGALVRLEMPDVTGASVQAMDGHFGRAQIEMDVLSQLPPAMQSAITGADGAYSFSAAESYSKVRYLTVTSADGKSRGGRIVHEGELKVDLELHQALAGSAGLVIETSTRFQALPVRFMINGEPHSTVVPAGERLSIRDLPEGDWRITASWQNETILDGLELSLSEPQDLFLPLPQGAINGQSKAMRDALQ